MQRAVIVDIDGTLIQSADQDDRIYRRAVEKVIGGVRFRPDLADYEPVTDSGILLQVLADSGIAPCDSLLADVKAEFVAGIRDHIEKYGPFPAVPGARRFIGRLKSSSSADVAIATGGWRDSATIKLDSAGFDTAGVPLATSDDAIERIEIMRIALNSLPGRFDGVTYYGDALWDREACRRLGWEFCAVGPKLAGIETFAEEPGSDLRRAQNPTTQNGP